MQAMVIQQPQQSAAQFQQVPAQQVPMQQVPVQQVPVQQMQMQAAYSQPQATVVSTSGNQPDVLVAYLLMFFLGLFGIHHLYMGRGVGVWIISMVTLQGLFVWLFLDLFLIPSSCAKVRGGQIVIVT